MRKNGCNISWLLLRCAKFEPNCILTADDPGEKVSQCALLGETGWLFPG